MFQQLHYGDALLINHYDTISTYACLETWDGCAILQTLSCMSYLSHVAY